MPESGKGWRFSLIRIAAYTISFFRVYTDKKVTNRAGARWLGLPQAWTLVSPVSNILHLTHNIYINKNVDLF